MSEIYRYPLLPHLDHACYHQATKLRGYRRKITVMQATTARDAAAVLRRLNPSWSCEDHARLAKAHFDAAALQLTRWHSLLDEASLVVAGRLYQPSDYRISAIARDDYPEPLKAAIRIAAHGHTYHEAASMAHLSASGHHFRRIFTMQTNINEASDVQTKQTRIKVIKRTKAMGDAFIKAVRTLCLQLGARETGFRGELEFDTAAGHLTVNPYDTWIACRFEDPALAKSIAYHGASLNPYSGKWNFMFMENTAQADCLDQFRTALERVLSYPALCLLPKRKFSGPRRLSFADLPESTRVRFHPNVGWVDDGKVYHVHACDTFCGRPVVQLRELPSPVALENLSLYGEDGCAAIH